MTDEWNQLIDQWHHSIQRRSTGSEDIVIAAPLQPSTAGGSGTFLAVDVDGERWWVKPHNNPQGGKVIVSEFVVGKLGQLIGAPCCQVVIARIPKALEGWEFRPGARLVAGLSPASRAVQDAVEGRDLLWRDRDDNRRRHAGVFAIYDWCWGSDDQWLYSQSRDLEIYSHDHGHYLPGGPNWSVPALASSVDDPRPPTYSTSDLDVVELDALAARLDAITRNQIADVLNSVPSEWPVSDDELAGLGSFLERRAGQVAARLRSIVGGTP